MTEQQRPDRPELPKLPAGAGGILPTVWVTFVVTVLLALAFSFANVWELGRTLGIEKHVAPLIGPAVDLTAVGLLVVVPWLVLAGVPTKRLGAANKLMAAAGFLTLALNSAPAAIKGWTRGDATAWGRAAVEAIVPFLLMAWSHVGPKLVAIFVEVRERHAERVAEILRTAEEGDSRLAEERAREVSDAVAAALSNAASRHEREVAEVAAQCAELESSLRAAEERHRAEREAAEESLRTAREALAEARRRAVERAQKRTPDRAPKAPSRAPRRSLDEWVALAKEALPTWQLETPTGTQIGSALDLSSEGTISKIRQRLEADRSVLPTSTPKGA